MAPLLPFSSSRTAVDREQTLNDKPNGKIPLRGKWTQFMSSDTKNHLVAGIGEFIGTFLFLWFAFAGTAIANLGANDPTSMDTATASGAAYNSTRLLYISFAFGISLMVNAWVFYRISGGLFNPAVTIALTILRDVTIARGLLLCAVQCGAACVAAWLVDIMYPTPMTVSAALMSGASTVQGLFIEAVCTAMLVFAIIMLAKEKHRATFLAPVGIGLAMFISELASVNFTGGALNPARWLGPAAVTKTFVGTDWIYVIGPIIGAVVAVMFFKLFKFMEYEMANPGQDGDFTNDPTQNPDHELARKLDSRHAHLEELRSVRSGGHLKSGDTRHSNGSPDVRYRQESSSTACTNSGDCSCGSNGCSMFGGDAAAAKDLEANRRPAGDNMV